MNDYLLYGKYDGVWTLVSAYGSEASARYWLASYTDNGKGDEYRIFRDIT